jgi:3-phenylpropionate/trans-cinnamate dioxygenase ferredoxin reductase subunit
VSAGVVIVGAGHAGVQVAASLRQRGFEAPITLLGEEPGPPYQRPPLSKELLGADQPAAGTTLRPESFFAKHDIELRTGTRATAIDRAARTVALDSGEQLPYAHLVLATGARAKRLPVAGAELDGVQVLRTLDDALALRERLVLGARVVIAGAGFIGLEVAAAARKRGAEVTVVEVAPRCMGRALSAGTAAHLVQRHAAAGATIRVGVGLTRMVDDGRGRLAAVVLADGVQLAADLVVVGVGVSAATELAADAGLSVADGVVVDATLRTGDPAIFAIGDCCRFPLPDGRRVRLESVQNAADHARAAAAAIAGDPEAYDAVPWFWSDQHDRRLQIAGLLDEHDRSVVREDPDSDGFSAFLYAGDRLVAVESINMPRDHLTARKLLATGVSPTPLQAADPHVDLRDVLVTPGDRPPRPSHRPPRTSGAPRAGRAAAHCDREGMPQQRSEAS